MEKENEAGTSYMYRTPFTTGHVFSSSMVDSMLYQSFGKPFLIEFIRLFIGVDHIEGSGSLTSVCIKTI
jgi:potassium channel subfamily T protein 1